MTNERFGTDLNFIKIYYAITACTTLYTENEDLERNGKLFKKMGLFSIFLYTITLNCVTTGAKKLPIEYMFCSVQGIKSFRLAKSGLFSSVLKNIIPNNISPTFQEEGGVT